MTDNRKSLSRPKSVAFASVDQQDFEATYQRDLINQWLEQVKDASTRYRMEKFNGMNCYFDDNEAKTVGNNAKSFKEQLIETQKHRPIQSGDHFFMRTVDDLAGEKKIPKLVLDHGGTHILDFKDDDGANVCVPFLLDYTRRWNSRLDHFSGVVETEVPLLFTSFNFFCSNTMLIITITLQLYYMIGCAISVIFFGGLTGSIYHTFGVLAGILLGSYVVKGAFFSAGFEKVSQLSASFKAKIMERGNKGDDKEGKGKIEEYEDEEMKELRIRRSALEAQYEVSGNPGVDSPIHADVTTPQHGVAEQADKTNLPPKPNNKSKARKFFDALFAQTPREKKQREESMTGRKVKANGLMQGQGFMEVLNLATEYLTRMASQSHGFSARMYSTYLLYFAYIVVPVYMIYTITTNWVKINDCRYHRHFGFTSADQKCNLLNFQALFFLGFTVQFFATVLGILNLVVSLSVLLYSADVANALTKYWLHRFRHLRRIAAPADEKDEKGKDKKEGEEKPKEDTTPPGMFTLKDIQPLIERDAYERYLFTHTYFKEASSQWSLYLTACLVVSFALFLQAYFTVIYIYAWTKTVSLDYVVLCAINISIFSFIFACMAYANGAVENIREGFLYAGANDYALMGKRAEWLEYVDKAPIYWYIFGFAIKKSDIASYVGGIVSAIVGGVVMSMVVSES